VEPGGELRRAAPDGQTNNVAAVTWLLEHKVDPNALWAHWDANVTPLHLAVMVDHADVVRAGRRR
jgi:hypothetical protein